MLLYWPIVGLIAWKTPGIDGPMALLMFGAAMLVAMTAREGSLQAGTYGPSPACWRAAWGPTPRCPSGASAAEPASMRKSGWGEPRSAGQIGRARLLPHQGDLRLGHCVDLPSRSLPHPSLATERLRIQLVNRS